ncbi:MAG: hypothetical protein LQ346_008439 [Caloplaca aetnensis]|nr:MAG: hypothetical protein LQ346_008439 [Caloplaca aetnensis]
MSEDTTRMQPRPAAMSAPPSGLENPASAPPPAIPAQQQTATFPVQPSSADSPAPPLTNIHADIDMLDAAPSPAAVPPSAAATPTAQRTATPQRNTNGNVEAPPPLPAKAAIHGAPARRYLNEKVTGVLLEGMKKLAVEQYVRRQCYR